MRKDMSLYHNNQVIQSDLFIPQLEVTFARVTYCNHPEKVKKNCQEYVIHLKLKLWYILIDH